MVTTVKQRNFAKLVATGMPKTHAYDQVYGKRGGKSKGTRTVAASQESNKPQVQAAIEEFEEQLTPIEDWRALRREMLQNIRYLAKQAKDEKVRMAASVHLAHYADERDKRELQQARQPVTIDGLIHEIRQLDAPAETVELESVDETAEPAE